MIGSNEYTYTPQKWRGGINRVNYQRANVALADYLGDFDNEIQKKPLKGQRHLAERISKLCQDAIGLTEQILNYERSLSPPVKNVGDIFYYYDKFLGELCDRDIPSAKRLYQMVAHPKRDTSGIATHHDLFHVVSLAIEEINKSIYPSKTYTIPLTGTQFTRNRKKTPWFLNGIILHYFDFLIWHNRQLAIKIDEQNDQIHQPGEETKFSVYRRQKEAARIHSWN